MSFSSNAMTACATSSGVAIFRKGVAFANACSCAAAASSPKLLLNHLVETRPGETELTRISGAKASASERVSCTTAALETAYAIEEPDARWAAIEAMLTIAPPAFLTSGDAAQQQKNVPRRFTLRMSFQTSSVSASRSGCGMKCVVPALLTSTSSLRYRSTVDPTMALTIDSSETSARYWTASA